MTKPGRKLDHKQTNRRQKHELAYRAKRCRCSKLAIILADMLADYCEGSYEEWIELAQDDLRAANRAARKAGKL